MAADPRKQRSQCWILDLAKWLREINEQPEKFIASADELLPILKDQKRTYSFSNETRGIYGQGLNRVKRNAGVIEGGWCTLDNLRKDAFKKLERAVCAPNNKAGKPGTKAELAEKKKQAKDRELIARQDMLLLTMLLEKSMHQARCYALDSRNPSIQALCSKEQGEIRSKLSATSMGKLTTKKLKELIAELEQETDDG